MVEEVVGSIIEAEDKAERTGKEARAAAKQIVSDARQSSENRRAACVQECRAAAAALRNAAREKGEEDYARAMEAGRAQAEALRAAQEKNRQKAALVILAAILPQ